MTDVSDNTASAERERLLITAAEQEASQFSSSPVPLLPPIEAITGYKIIREIGHGGMGVVYEALQEGTHRNVALKVMLSGPFASPAARLRFDREVELAARLQHPAIVRVLESSLLPTGQRYYAMDLVGGLALDRHVAQVKPDLRTLLGLFVELCGAVEHAHQHGVIHRDLKPGNVLVDAEGKPHVLDFGLAKATDQVDSTATLAAEVSSPGQVMGTLRYLSPEQAAGRPEEVDQRTDVYALGVVLFEAVTGSMPYDTTGHPSTVIQRILEQPPARPSSLSDRVDGELETILLKALEKEKIRRYQSAREMGEDLGRYLRGEAILAKPPSTLYRLRKKVWKHRWRVAIGTAALVLTVVGVWAGLWAHQRLRESQAAETLLRIDRSLRQGNYPLAIDGCQTILRDPRARKSATLQRGHAYLCSREYALAIEDYTKAIEYYAPHGDAWPYYHRATALWVTGHRDQAAADYLAFLRLRPDHLYAAARLVLVLCDQGNVLEQEGRTEDAERIRREAEEELAQARAHAVPGSWIGEILACIAQELAPQDLIVRAASQSMDKRCEAYYYAAEASLLTRRTDQARQWFQECVKTDLPIDPQAGYAAPMSEWHLARWRLGQLTVEVFEPTSRP
jgi:tetratricopeptide (TPR) repeat protein